MSEDELKQLLQDVVNELDRWREYEGFEWDLELKKRVKAAGMEVDE